MDTIDLQRKFEIVDKKRRLQENLAIDGSGYEKILISGSYTWVTKTLASVPNIDPRCLRHQWGTAFITRLEVWWCGEVGLWQWHWGYSPQWLSELVDLKSLGVLKFSQPRIPVPYLSPEPSFEVTWQVLFWGGDRLRTIQCHFRGPLPPQSGTGRPQRKPCFHHEAVQLYTNSLSSLYFSLLICKMELAISSS